MNNIGIKRRVDELGRIVIPKEIRTYLGIKPGDWVDAYLDNEKIFLVKHDSISKNHGILNTVLNTYSKLLNIDILITNTNKIIEVYGKRYNAFKNKKITNYIYQTIENRKKVVEESKKLFSNNSNYIICPIIVNGDAVGSIIFIREEENINEIDKMSISVIENLFINNLEV